MTQYNWAQIYCQCLRKKPPKFTASKVLSCTKCRMHKQSKNIHDHRAEVWWIHNMWNCETCKIPYGMAQEMMQLLEITKKVKLKSSIVRAVEDGNCFGWFLLLLLLLLLHQRYNSGRVLAFSTVSLHLCRSWTRSDHFTTFSFLRSFLTSSSHLDLGLPTGRFVNGCHLYISFTTLDSAILFMCPNQLNLWDLT